MSKPEIYISFDIEADGPCPGLNSMLSLGAAAYLPDGTLVDTFHTNLEELVGATQNEDTMNWWATQPSAWNQARSKLETCDEGMQRFGRWIDSFCGAYKPVAVAYPAGFDWPFLYYYCHKFLGNSPLGFACVDMKTMAMMLMGTDFSSAAKRRMPGSWFDNSLKHDHNALNDAVEQGYTFVQMFKAKGNL